MELPLDWIQSIAIPFYANLQCNTLGHDSAKNCFDRKHYQNFHPIHYQFNEIGFRTKSISNFTGHEILAVGDSFTLGLGVNPQDRWTDQLELLLGYPVLNFSLNGASNDWISRKINNLLQVFTPRCIIIHWTFSHRREKNLPEWHDNERTECEPGYNEQENLSNWLKNFQSVKFSKVIHSAIPNWHDNFDYSQYPVLPPVNQIDLARDGFHYGPLTHLDLAQKFTNLLASV
jgi:hypothetical protein